MRRLAAAAVLLALAAALVVSSGVISIKASSRHWAVTSWILDFAKRRSVATRSAGITPPPLTDDALVQLGAAHYDGGCRPCHGRPGGSMPVIPAGMTPQPPDLARQMARWQPREIYYLVAHGIKFTGMPAWPAPERHDEVWAVVAFLRALPGLDAAAYARLAAGAAPAVNGAVEGTDAAAARCAACHRPDAREPGSDLVPVLTGQRLAYVTAALDAYASGARKSGIMGPIAAALDSARRHAVAAHVTVLRDAGGAGLAPAPPPGGVVPSPSGDPADSSLFPSPGGVTTRGDLVSAGDPARDVPPCAGRHGPAARERDPRFPKLAGQREGYLRRQLQLFAENRRGGSPYADIMRAIAVRLTPQQIDQAARAYAALPGAEP